MSNIARLIEERKKAWDRCNEILSRAEGENRDLTAEERQNWDAADARVGELSADIERHERTAKYGEVDFGQVLDEKRDGAQGGGESRGDQYAGAFSNFLRRGIADISTAERELLAARMQDLTAEQRAQSTSGSAGGYTIPPGFLTRITETLKAFGGIMNAAEVITTDTGNGLQWPSFDGTAQAGQILGENTAETALDMVVGQKTLGAFTYSSRVVQVSVQLAQDSAFNLDEFVARQLGIRIGRAVAPHLATGTGSGQPEGLITNATVGKTGLAGQGAALIYDDLVDLIHSVDPAYRAQKPQFVLADSTLKAVRKLKDTQGRPLWEPSLQAGAPDTILGYGYVIDQGIASLALNSKSLGFGDIRSAYVVRQVAGGQMLRLAERYAEALQVGYLAFLRLDAKPNDTAAFRVYQTAAS